MDHSRQISRLTSYLPGSSSDVSYNSIGGTIPPQFFPRPNPRPFSGYPSIHLEYNFIDVCGSGPLPSYLQNVTSGKNTGLYGFMT